MRYAFPVTKEKSHIGAKNVEIDTRKSKNDTVNTRIKMVEVTINTAIWYSCNDTTTSANCWLVHKSETIF